MNYYCVTAPYCALAEDDKCRMLQREAFVFSVAHFFFFLYTPHLLCVYVCNIRNHTKLLHLSFFIFFPEPSPAIHFRQLSFRISKLEYIFNTDAKWVTSMKR